MTNCVDIAVHHGFQGWLVNIENVVREDLVPALIDMLAKVDNGTKKSEIHHSHGTSDKSLIKTFVVTSH